MTARECTVRAFKLVPFNDQHLSVATEGQIKWKDEDVNFEYVPMIEKSHYDKAVGFIKDEKCACRSVQCHLTGELDLDMCGRCQALGELGEL